mgnify:FL=1
MTTGTTSSFRIGIDVGGTFTHAVAINADSLELVARAKVPTSHQASEGVARGIIESLHAVLARGKIDPASVSFIAHSTTQATNALLEGDVAPVGIIGMGSGASRWFAEMSTSIGSIELAKNKFLQTSFVFIDTSRPPEEAQVLAALKTLTDAGAKAIAVSESFSVDQPQHEQAVVETARSKGLIATCGSEVSKLYGLRVRTRTAVINAAMLPKMIETANMTEQSVRAAGITAPVMIMRSDGGVMDIDAMRQRPILTRLSGPAAGVAAAMMYLRISDAIFLEVGGTSTDISVIRNGKALIKDAEIGGHKVYARSLDVNTLGVAGGSMIRIGDGQVKDLGPRSAHIAGRSYVAFAEQIDKPTVELISPREGDPADYVALSDSGGAKLTLTTTCAANLLGLVPESDCARGNKDMVSMGFAALAAHCHADPQKLAQQVLDCAYDKVTPVVKKFANEYKLDLDSVVLIGGGGGAASLVPYIAKKLGVDHTLAKDADVISAIGVALALVRETVERQIPQPKQEDLIRIREEAFNAVARMGADVASIEVHVEIDPRSNVIRATAFGATSCVDTTTAPATQTEKEELATASFKHKLTKPEIAAFNDYFEVWACRTQEKRALAFLAPKNMALRVMDNRGVIRLKIKNGAVRTGNAGEAEKLIGELAEEHSTYGDAGKVIPDFMILSGAKIIDLSGLLDAWQVQAMARSELGAVPQDARTVIVCTLP